MHHTSLMNIIKGGDQGPESPENYFLCSGVRGEEGGKKEAEPIEIFDKQDAIAGGMQRWDIKWYLELLEG